MIELLSHKNQTTIDIIHEDENNELGDDLYTPVMNENSSVHISFAHLCVSTKTSSTSPIEKVILNRITGTIPGGFCAIMGGSGSGKTTFLSALSLRTDNNRMKISGKFHINGKPYNKKTLKLMSSYVMQDDLIDPNFSVFEVLTYMSQLRMSCSSTRDDMKERVIFVMKLMGIYHRRDVIVGDTRNKGISGGERKRLSVAIELLSKPFLLFLDEPTSGLDASTALSLMETLHEIANLEYCTVICTIHQPQPKIFDLFDNLILMKDGSIIYQGDCSKCVPFFQNLGFQFNEKSNPADQVIEFIRGHTVVQDQTTTTTTNVINNPINTNYVSGVSIEANVDQHHITSTTTRVHRNSITNRVSLTLLELGLTIEKPHLPSHSVCDELSAIEASEFLKALNTSKHQSTGVTNPHKARSRPFVHDIEMNNDLWQLVMQGKVKPTPNLSLGCDKPSLELIGKQPWIAQFLILLKRSLHSSVKRYDIFLLNIFATILLAFIISSSVWYDIGTHKEGSSKRYPSLFFCTINQGVFAVLQGTHKFPMNRALMLRDRSAGACQASSYFLASTFADMLLQIIPAIIFTCIAYPRIGYQSSHSQFAIFMGIMILVNFSATALANMISCVCVGIDLSSVVLAVCWDMSRLYGGYFISPTQLKEYPDWKFLDAISFVKYAFVAVSLNEDSTLLVTCLPSELNSAGQCVISPINVGPYTGTAYNNYYGYDEYTIGFCVGMLIVYVVVCKIISYLALRYIKI